MMANTYFQFKQFRIDQGSTAMKVCTDSCILGAYAEPKPEVRSVLDIGTGTGLLALMLAQRIIKKSLPGIDAVEIDQAAYEQARQNVANSPWAAQVEVYHEAVQTYSQSCGRQYDFIVTNPPFFEGHIKTRDIRQNLALHSECLTFGELIASIDLLLAKEGRLAVLLPVYQMQQFEALAQYKNLAVVQRLHIHNHPGKLDFRTISYFERNAKNGLVVEQELFIRNAKQSYTQEFIDLLGAYYLNF